MSCDSRCDPAAETVSLARQGLAARVWPSAASACRLGATCRKCTPPTKHCTSKLLTSYTPIKLLIRGSFIAYNGHYRCELLLSRSKLIYSAQSDRWPLAASAHLAAICPALPVAGDARDYLDEQFARQTAETPGSEAVWQIRESRVLPRGAGRSVGTSASHFSASCYNEERDCK